MSTAFQNYQAQSASASDSNLVSPSTAAAIVNKAHTASNNTTSTIPRKRGYQAAFGADMNDNATGDVQTASTLLADFTASSSISSSSSTTSHFASSLVASPSIYHNLSSLGDAPSTLVSSPSISEGLSSLAFTSFDNFASPLIFSSATSTTLSTTETFTSGLVASPSTYENLSALAADLPQASSDNTVEPNGTKPASPLSSGNLASQDDNLNNKKPSQGSTLPTPTPTRKAPKAGLYGPGRRAPGGAAPTDSATSSVPPTPTPTPTPAPTPKSSPKAGLYGAGRRGPQAAAPTPSTPTPSTPTTPSSSAAPAPSTPAPTPNPALTPTPREKRVRTRIVSTRQRAASAKGRTASGRAGGPRARQSSALRISVLRRNAFRARRAEMVAKAKEVAVAKPQPKEAVVVKTEVKTEVKRKEMSGPGEEIRTVRRGRGREVARKMREATETETGQETPVEREQKRARVGSDEGKSGMVAAKADEQPMEGAEMVIDSE